MFTQVNKVDITTWFSLNNLDTNLNFRIRPSSFLRVYVEVCANLKRRICISYM